LHFVEFLQIINLPLQSTSLFKETDTHRLYFILIIPFSVLRVY